MKIYLRSLLALLVISIFLPTLSHAQNISGIVNNYARVLAFPPCPNQITVQTTTGFGIGDTILIIQMRGAAVDVTNGNNTPQYGDITNYQSSGNYEVGIIVDIVGLDITLENELIRTYDPAGDVQIVRIPQYDNATIVSTLTAQPWNGATGGIVIVQVKGTLTMQADINVSGLGFLGGDESVNGCTNCFIFPQSMAYPGPSTESANKGEGVVRIEGEEAGQGKWGNGGGGGNCHNSGGGGGSNAGFGGDGGISSSTCTFLVTHGPGRGGQALQYDNIANKTFMGGAGGGGHQNNLVGGGPPAQTGGTPGGNGGGIVMIIANSLNGNGNSIISRGVNVNVTAFEDGAGGGGAGGTTMLDVNSYPSTLTVDLSGGDGGSTMPFGPNMRDLGPGGGGGGGLLWVKGGSVNANITAMLNRGLNGSSQFCGCPWSSAPGGLGATLTGLSIPQSSVSPGPGCVLPVELAGFQASPSNDGISLEWTTLSEINNDYFLLERSVDLVHFTEIGKVPGSGNSLVNRTYQKLDRRPEYGLNYYRLTQIDLNGQQHYGGMVAARFEPAGELVLRVYPNPAAPGQSLTIDLPPGDHEFLQIEVIDAMGRIVHRSEMPYAQNERSMPLRTDKLSAGMYHIQVYSSEIQASGKVIISD